MLLVIFLLVSLFPQALPVFADALPLDHVVISPSSATMAVGGTQQFTAQGQNANNVSIPDLTYFWAVVAGGGTISNTGLFTAGNATGTYANTIQVIAVQGSIIKAAHASVTITGAPGPLDHVVISPSSATMAVGGTRQFTAQGQDANNVSIPGLTYFWAMVAGGGTISNTGLFTAGNATGTYANTIQVIAVQGSIIKAAHASVTMTGAPARVCQPPGWLKGKKGGWQHGTPPGWLQGKKRGWQHGMPPGWLKGKKTGWQPGTSPDWLEGNWLRYFLRFSKFKWFRSTN
jgi:hypothetical protein